MSWFETWLMVKLINEDKNPAHTLKRTLVTWGIMTLLLAAVFYFAMHYQP